VRAPRRPRSHAAAATAGGLPQGTQGIARGSPRMNSPGQIRIFDTTLRDGEQSPGCSMTPQQKLVMARALAELGVDIIETGFPASSQSDREATALIARELRGTT